jgi:hypothetical protein
MERRSVAMNYFYIYIIEDIRGRMNITDNYNNYIGEGIERYDYNTYLENLLTIIKNEPYFKVIHRQNLETAIILGP